MNDYKKKYFISVLGSHFDFQIIEDTWDKDIVGQDEILEFLHKASTTSLWAFIDENNDKRKIRFQKEFQNATNSRVVVFSKIKPLVLNDENLISSLQIISLQGPPTTALYHTLNNVFSPLIIKNRKRNVNQSNIERQLANLQAGLRTTILTTNLDSDPLKHVDINSLSVILNLEHEIEFWNTAIQNAKNSDTKATYTSLRDTITPLAKDFSVLDALPLPEVEDLLENAHNVLDDLWRHEPPYPRARMEHLMEVIASDVIKRLSKDIMKVNFWTEDFNITRDVLEQCLSTGNRWINTCKQLTHIFWPNYSLHAWTGEYFVPMNLVDAVNGIQEVYDIRTIHRQLTRLLSTNEQQDLVSDKIFKPFEDLQVLNYGPHTEQEWRTAKKQFEYLLQPAEQRVAQKLKKQLSGVKANTRQLLHEYARYSELISRPTVKQTLQNERQYLLEALLEYIKILERNSIEPVQNFSMRFDTPPIICEISSAKQIECKANDVLKISKKLLDDLQNYNELLHMVTELVNNAKQQHNELFESWCSDVIVQIKNKTLSLKENEPVIQFSEDKLMRVSYSPGLVSMISEVRQLSAIGYNIPSSIEDTYIQAKKFMKYAKILEQIANFHNTIGDRMIPSQRPLMLASALNLSRLVQEEEVVYWSDVVAVEKYIDKLKSAVENLSSENNLLTNYHLQILEKIRDLENIDLIRQYQKWKDAAKNIRDIVSQVQNKGFKSMQSWKIDLERQLAKVLEIQYLKSLHTVHLYLPEIYADLIYREGRLQYSPNEKALREKYANQMKRFLDIPKSFRGISDNHEIFSEIIERSKYEIDKVNQNTEGLFEQLKGVQKHWASWLTLESLENSKLAVWQDWDLHFRASKTFGQEIAKLPNTEEKVGCFIIGLIRLRNDLESHNRSYWDKLTVSLKDSIAEDVVKLQIYVDSTTATLNRQPVTMEQIGEADASHANILRDRPQMEDLYESMCLKSKTLASWTREQIDSVNRLQAAWERLQSLLENHEHIIAKQMQTIKTTLNIASENLNKKIESFGAKWDQVKPRPNSGQIAHDTLPELHKYLDNIKQKRIQWKELMEEKQKIVVDFEKFGMLIPDFFLCDEIDVDLTNMENTWSLFEEFYADFEKLGNEEWIVFRKKSYLLEEFLFDWQTKLQKLEPTPLVTRILKEIHNYQSVIPTLKLVKGEDFTDKHWLEVYTLLRIEPKALDILCLKDFLNISDTLLENTKKLQIICKKAAGEVIVRQALAEINQWEVQSHFSLIDHLDFKKRNIALIKDFKEILNKIGDNQSLLQSVKNAADFDSFSEQAGIWENKLADLETYLTNLAQIQRKWIYLEPIFGSGTLNHEAGRFERLDRDFRNVLNFIEKDSRVCTLLRYSNLRSVLENLQDQLVRCQKSLDEFLTDKRNNFPRFLFLGDDDLLEVVGQSSQENVIQSHLKKLFAGIHSIRLNEQGNKIVAMCSLEGEVVELDKPVDINQRVEVDTDFLSFIKTFYIDLKNQKFLVIGAHDIIAEIALLFEATIHRKKAWYYKHLLQIWLNCLVDAMHLSLRSLLTKCLADGQNADPSKYPSQILCLADGITFTSKCEQAISNMTLSPLLATYKTQLGYYSSLELESDTNSDREYSSNVLELKLKALLLDTIHHINVIEELIDENISKTSDWTWQKQLRFYSKSSVGDVTVKMANAEMEYSFEYLGNGQKLVRTPLTERCFLTLTQGMYLGMGGNPYGPAGTGKTESVKALGSLLGRQVLVFNCDEGIDASSMGRIISGLVKTGAWGCFDEFNRLDEATLSAISMYIQPIQMALKNRNDTVILLDQEIKLNKHCGIFVTLNPAGGNYGGRNKLPDNLKQLFRPVVMTHPDHEQIARTLLHCNGYKKADLIAGKLVEIFRLSNLLLSKQQHYDWGLRALKTVLNGCSQGIKEYKKSTSYIADSNFEFALVTKALKMDTLSKLTFNDHQKFEALVTDIFQNVPGDINDDDKLKKILAETCKELGFYINQRQLDKCLELHEQLKQRMGVAIIGPPSSGKSTVKKILFHALNKMGHTLKEKVFNPKSLPRVQLLGQIDPDTRQWSDGVLSLYSTQVTAEPQSVWSWITCDGDIDPEWVESLNSVLDDNRLLSLPSGWRIQFGPNVNFIFESHELRNASPATISRMGIVFFSEEIVTTEDYVANNIKAEIEASGFLESFYNDYFYRAINWILNEGELVIPCSKIGVVKTALSQLAGVSTKGEFTVSLINALGGQLQIDFKEIFAQQVFSWVGETAPPVPDRIFYNGEQGIIESYFTKSSNSYERNTSPLIRTAQVCQAIDVLGKYLIPGKEQHFLLIGSHGSAKSYIIEHLVKIRSEVDMTTVHCSAYVTPHHIIHKLKQNCIIVNSSKGRVFKPKKGHLVMYFKNVHLLKPDSWGTSMLIEFLQQLITYGGFFDDGLEWVGIENVTIVGSLSLGSTLSTRFSSLLHIYNVELPEKEDLHLICLTYLRDTIKEIIPLNDSWLKKKLSKMASSMISIYNEVKESFKSNEYRHYVFSPHDITCWCQNLLRYRDENKQEEADNFIIEIVCKEALQIFGNRLVNEADKSKLDAILNNILLSDWGKSYLTDKITASFFVPVFTSTRNMPVLAKMETADWFSLVKKGVMLYEREGHILDVLFIPELLNLTASLSTSLTRDAGSVLLIGSAGVGRKSAVRIVSALQSAKLVIPISAKLFNNELKYVMQHSGIEGENVILILEDHLFNTTVLNTVSTLLSSGEVPGLYNLIEFESLISGLRDEASREGFEGNLGNYFVERVRKKLHVVICLDTCNDKFWEILADYPVLYQKCDVIWQSEWSSKSMETVPNLLIDKHNKEKPNESVELCSGFTNIHKSVENSSVATPLRFIELIKNYIRFYVQKKNLVIKRKSKLQAGVDKLTEARSVVADLKIKAAEQQEKLAEKQSKANAALDMISNTMEHANTQKQEMEILKRNTENENEQLVKRKREIEQELAEVEPLIKEAGAAVGNIKTEALSEIRSLRAPPDIIRDILEGVLRLMGIQDTSWNSMKTFLAKRGVKEDIRSFDASRITTENRQAVEKLMQNRGDSFDPKSSKRASVAAAPLAAWVTANVRYSHVLDKIKPLTKEQNRLQRNLEAAKLQLGELSSGLTNVDATVSKLKEQLSTYTKEAAEIEIHLGMAQETLQAAERLVDKLNDEYSRWQKQLSELSEEIKSLPSYCLLAAAFVSYLSGEPEDTRINLLQTWNNILAQDTVSKFSLEEFLSSERENLQWQSEGLASDQLSIQNAIIMLNSDVIPLVIDPTSVAFDWIKEHYKNKTLESINENSPKFNTTLELAIRFGKILIIEDVNNIPAMLLPIIRKEFIYSGERKTLNINGKLIDCHNDFRLILTCRHTMFKLPAYLSSSIMIVNFSITHSGLTEKLLIGAIRQENPQLEERRKQLLKDREEMQEKQYNLQNQLLEDLANSTGNILENKSLLESLNQTKASSNAISEALTHSNEVRQKLAEEYEIYKDISAFGSSLYFAIIEFSKMNVLYSISIHSYTKLFLKSLSSSQDIENTFGFLQKILVQSVYQFVGRGILKADRPKFILHLIHAIYPKQIPEEEWIFFLGQITNSKVDSKHEYNVPSWIPEQLHHHVQLLQVYQPNIYTTLNLAEATVWKNFMNTSECETKFPQHAKLTEFQKILIIQILRPDRLYSALMQFCLHVTGLKNLNLDVLQLSQVVQESSCSEPILLLTTSGNDPSVEIRELAENKRGAEKYIEIAMGEGQEVKALASIKETSQNGHWIILKNLHLVTNWLPILLQELQNLKPNPEFRMWLITESQNSFNLVLAQNSLKIAYEAPQGIRNNLLRTYATWGPDYFINLKPTSARIFFILACVNALLQERRNYVPQGWSKWYDFSDVDLIAAVKLTTPALVASNAQVPWKLIKGLCADAVYGGRIENIQDFSILESYLNEFFLDDVLSHRWKPFNLNNSIPLSTKYDDYVNAILQLSHRDLPSYFGLSENIDRSWEKNVSKDIIKDLKLLEGDKIKQISFNRQTWQKGLTPYINLWKKLNQGQDFVKINLKPNLLQSKQSPIMSFIQEEFYNAVFLIQKIHKNFTSLNRLSRASCLPDDKTTILATSLLNQQVPKCWSKLWNGPSDPNKYLRYIIVKTVKIRNWQTEEINYFFTVPMNLSLLFNPETFLAAFKQHYSREHQIPLDELVMQTTWKKTLNSVILEGLLISGALFDGILLSTCTPSTESINPVPHCYITWIQKKNAVINDKFINVPLYYTSDRDKQIAQIQIPCDFKEKDKWIKTGLAFFLSY